MVLLICIFFVGMIHTYDLVHQISFLYGSKYLNPGALYSSCKEVIACFQSSDMTNWLADGLLMAIYGA